MRLEVCPGIPTRWDKWPEFPRTELSLVAQAPVLRTAHQTECVRENLPLPELTPVGLEDFKHLAHLEVESWQGFPEGLET